MEGIGRDIEVDEVERPALLDQRRAEKRGSFDRRERQRNEQREGQRNHPQADEYGAAPPGELTRLAHLQIAKAADDWQRDVGQDGHLQQSHEPVGRPLEHAGLIAEKQSQHDPGG